VGEVTFVHCEQNRKKEENKMIKEVTTNIYRIGVPLPNNPLKETNCYFIKGNNSDLLVDTGFHQEECRIPLLESLEKLGARQESLDVLITHMHSDHLGLAGEMAGKNRKIYLSRKDTAYLKKALSGRHSQEMHRRMVAEGFPEGLLTEIEATMPSRKYAIEVIDGRFNELDEGDSVTVGDYCLQMVSVPGHTPGNAMYWIKQQQIMLTGDHILFDITPNITAFADEDDSLGSYIDSLHKAKEFPVKLALPGHRMQGDYYHRIWELLQHHRDRIMETQRIIYNNPKLTAYEIAAHMSWNIRAKSWDEFPGNQKWYAVGECLSHLDYLRKRNLIERHEENNVLRYRARHKPNIFFKVHIDEYIAYGNLLRESAYPV